MDHELKTSVHKDSLVNYKGRKYSVPPKYIGKDVLLKQIEEKIRKARKGKGVRLE